MRIRQTRCLPLLLWTLLLAGCGGGGGGGTAAGSTAVNVQPISVSASPSNAVNVLYASVTVCSPGGNDCGTVDHVQVDTGSSGLRIIASQLPASLSLPTQTDAGGNYASVECTQFADGFAWGPVKTADVKISGEEAAAIPIQVIGDPAFAAIPDNCSSSGPPENTVAAFGANGVLGVGALKQDCGSTCATYSRNNLYYSCPISSGCTTSSASTVQPLDLQVVNPVAHFANDNNGVVITLPALSVDGAASVNGSLIFGIGTESNNGLGNAQVFMTRAGQGTFTTIYKTQSFYYSLFDSGSTNYYFDDATIPVCSQSDPIAPGFYCPTATQSLSATIRGINGASATLGFGIANAHDLAANHPDYWAFSNVGAPTGVGSSGYFIWGLPAFYGHSIYTAIEGQTTPAGDGPFFAYF